MSVTAMNENGQVVCVPQTSMEEIAFLSVTLLGTLKKSQCRRWNPALFSRFVSGPDERVAERAGLCLCMSFNRKGHVVGFYGRPHDCLTSRNQKSQ